MMTFLQCLITASVMLTVACAVAALLFRQMHVATPGLRQSILFCVLLQGLMLYRMPIELPVLSSRPIDAATQTGPFRNLESSSEFGLGTTAPESTATPTSFVAPPQTRPSLETQPHRRLASSIDVIAGLAFAGWLIGMTLIVLRSGFRYARLCRLVDRLEPAPDDWQTEWQSVFPGRGHPAPEMLVSGSAGPMLVRRPRGYALVIPKRYWQSLSPTQRRGVLLHELAHLRRGDVWRQLVARFAAALHWFNPASWWCVRRYEESVEWACDTTLMKSDPAAAKGLASSLVRLVDFLDQRSISSSQCTSGVGVQSMAAPPLTARVTRLLKPSSSGDSVMKRLSLGLLATGLLAVSAFQFRLIAASPDETSGSGGDSKLQILSADSKDQLKALRQRLNSNDKATSDLKQLLTGEAGQVAFAGAIDQLKGKYRETARAEAIPRFVEKHFVVSPENKLTLRDESHDTAESWIARSKHLGEVLDSMQQRLQSVAERLDDSTETNRMAQRMLTDDHVAFAIMLEEFDGRSDPIDLFLSKALEKILVRRGDKMVVVPTLPEEGRRQIERFEMATKVFEKLQRELPEFADEFAQKDARHKQFIAKLDDPTMSAVLALHLTRNNPASASTAIDELFSQLEKVSRDTPDGLVIDNDEAWQNIDELTDAADRAGKRIDAVRDRLTRLAADLDLDDPMTARFASEMKSGVIAYQVAADVPYDDFDLGKQVESIISQVMEPSGTDRLRIRDDAAAQVEQRAAELLGNCRTIRRYLRRVDDVLDRLSDRELADALDGPGRMLLLAEIRRSAERGQTQLLDLLAEEFFVVDETTRELTVRPERAELVEQLIRRANELEHELSKDDF